MDDREKAVSLRYLLAVRYGEKRRRVRIDPITLGSPDPCALFIRESLTQKVFEDAGEKSALDV